MVYYTVLEPLGEGFAPSVPLALLVGASPHETLTYVAEKEAAIHLRGAGRRRS